MSEETQDLDRFRSDMARWIEACLPGDLRHQPRTEDSICWGGRDWVFRSESQRHWLERCIEKGLTAPRWPRAYGGAGYTRAQEKVFREELARAGAPTPLESFGLWMLGPALLAFGTEAQKAHFLPQITRGQIRWCQGYSEPGAGSDLANVQTRAEDRGDHWLVNGQKIWTSYADRADWIFALVRTDRDAPKHRGISFLLIDMASEGVSTRPIRLISGKSPFCETFFEDVKVPKSYGAGPDAGLSSVVGEVNRGWDVAKHLLTHEREMIGGGARGLLGGRSLGDFLGSLDAGVLDDPALRAEAMEVEIDTLATALTLERYKDMSESGQGAGHASAMLKYMGTELNKRRYELLMAATGSDGAEWDGPHGGLAAEWLRTKANSIEGGTSEIMLDILAKRVLDLPSA